MTDLAQNEARRSEQLRFLEQLCDEFESQWRSGQHPTLAEVLTKAPYELRSEAFRELLAIEVGYRRASGEQLSLSDYRQQFSEFEEAISQEFKARPETHSVSQADEPTFIPSPSQPEISPISAASSDPAAATQPERLDDYILLEELGHGGMGTVFKARHRKLKRIVALKVLPTDRMKDAAAVARFEREMEAVGTLDHPNIVRAFDAGEANGQHYLVMEYVRGADLSDVSAKVGRLKIADACEVVRQAALGLQSAHSHGMVHRDIKPSNLILTGGQPSQPATVKILDLGLALLSEQHSPSPKELTSTGQLMGTVDYMAPEQGIDTHSVDIRADIFSLGATLFKLLTGDVPLSGDKFNSPMKKLMALAMSQVPSISTKRPELPPGLVAIVDRMLAKEPAERFATPAEVAEALVPFARGHRLGALLTAATGDASYAELEPTDVASNDSASSPTLLASTADIAPADRELSETILAATQPLSATATRWSKLRIAITATALAAFLVLGAIVYRVQTDRGTLVVEIDESAASQIETQLKDGGLVFHDKARKRTWVVKPRQPDQPQSGTLRVEPIDGLQLTVSDDSGVQLKTEEFTLNRNGKVIVRVSLAKRSTDESPAVARLSSPLPVPPSAIAPFDAKQARAHQEAWARHLGTTVETTNSVGAKMILLPPGEFLMGSNDEQIAAALQVADAVQSADQATKDRIKIAERPQHRVVITKPFWMGATEVTVGQFKRFGASGYQTEAERVVDQPQAATYLSPGYAVTDDSPAAVITWNDAVAYCNWLSTQEQREPRYRLEGTRWLVVPGQSGYRLPTEAEWEYACRAGSTSQYSFGDDQRQLGQHGWYQMNADRRPHAVGTRPSNGFGLFDMHGNVQEWCQDFWDEAWYVSSPTDDPTGPVSRFNRVLRGGAWSANVSGCRAASRNNNVPSTRYGHYGFRVVREQSTPSKTNTASATATPPVAAGLSPAEAARNRAAAEFVIKKGGDVWIKPDRGASLNTRRLTDLPTGSFAVTSFSLRKIEIDQLLDVRDEELAAVAGLSQVVLGNFDCNQLSDTAFDTIATLPALDHLSLIRAKFSADGLAKLKALPKLTRLDFVETNCTGMLSRFHELPKVYHLTLSYGCRLSPADIEALAAAKPLRRLELNGVRLGDDHIAALGKLSQLQTLVLAGTGITAPGVERLVAALPKCEITSEHAVAGASIWILSLIDPVRDAVSIPDVTGANRWFVNPTSMNFGSDGKSGKLRLPVDVAGRDYQLFLHFEHRGGTPQVEVEVPLPAGAKSIRIDKQGGRQMRVTKIGQELEISDTADGPLKLRWRGDPTKSDGLIPYEQTRTDPKSIGLAVHGGSVQFYVVSLKFLDKPTATAATAPCETDPERRVAQWVLARGGSVGVISSKSSAKGYTRLADLPVGPLVVHSISLSSASGITPDEWNSLVHLSAVGYITLMNCNVDDAALASIGRLENLKRLLVINDRNPEDIARITDDGVRHLARLRRLEYLDLQNTAMTAQSLDAIGQLKRLTTLRLAGHSKLQIESLAPLRGLQRVHFLELLRTNLSDSALADLPTLQRVRNLNANHTKVSDAGVSHLNACRELRWLDLRGTQVTAAGIRQLADHPTLKLIGFQETRISPTDLLALANQFPRTMLAHPELKTRYAAELDAYSWIKSVGGTTGPSYTDALEPNGTFHAAVNVTFGKTIPDPKELRKLADVKFLNALSFVNNKNNSDATIRLALESLRDQPTLSTFYTGTTAISPETMRELSRHEALATLHLDKTDNSGTPDESLALLPSLPRLEDLFLNSSLATNEVWNYLAKLQELHILRIGGTQLTGKGLGELRAIPELHFLSLGGMPLTAGDLAPLAEFPDLSRLIVDKSTLDDAGLAQLAGCRTLRVVEARGTKVTAAGVAKLQQALPKCTVFWDGMLNALPQR